MEDYDKPEHRFERAKVTPLTHYVLSLVLPRLESFFPFPDDGREELLEGGINGEPDSL